MSSHDILTSWFELNVNIDKYIQKRKQFEQELRNKISSMKRQIKEYKEEKEVYYELFMEAKEKCYDCSMPISKQSLEGKEEKKNSKKKKITVMKVRTNSKRNKY